MTDAPKLTVKDLAARLPPLTTISRGGKPYTLLIPCDECDGRGYDRDCWSCGGKGTVGGPEVNLATTDCVKCNGHGGGECWYCDGKRKVTIEIQAVDGHQVVLSFPESIAS